MNITFDTLKYAKELEKAGFTRQQAEIQAESMRIQNDVFHAELKNFSSENKDVVATKHDLQIIKS